MISVERGRVLKTFVWLAALAATLSSGAAIAKDYDRYGLYGLGHPNGSYILRDPPGYEDMVWRRIVEAGGTSVRMAASWREIEAEKGKYDWSQLESTLKYCREYPQIRPYVLVVNTPGWARADGQPSHLPPTAEALPDFKKFCKDLAQRYKGLVNHYEIWNEQNGFGWEVPPYNQYDKYLPLLQAAYQGLKEGNPRCVVSTGGLDDAAGNGYISTKGYYDLQLKQYGGKKMWDACGNHPYGDTKSMYTKQRVLKGIAASYGHGDEEYWLTEYGFHTGEVSEEEQAKQLTDYMTAIITDPELQYITETNYLCLADFEQSNHSFGLCDLNLRPRPAFYAYQRLPRPGQVVISDIKIAYVSLESVTISWETDTESAGSVECRGPVGAGDKGVPTTSAGRTHSVTLRELDPSTTYLYRIRARAKDLPEAKTLEYEFATLAKSGLRNGGFENGFSIEIARNWECIGDNLCFDSARLDAPDNITHSGKHAQCIVSAWGDPLKDAVVGQAPAQAGRAYTFNAWTYGKTKTDEGPISRRVGIDPTGGKDPASPNVVWSQPSQINTRWELQTVSAEAKSAVITVFAYAEVPKVDEGMDLFYVDDALLTAK